MLLLHRPTYLPPSRLERLMAVPPSRLERLMADRQLSWWAVGGVLALCIGALFVGAL